MLKTTPDFSDASPWQIPRAVELADITVRDGIQSLETILSTEEKVEFLEGLILAGFKRVEVSNYAHPKLVPFFNDIDEVFKRLLNSEKVGHLLKQNRSPEDVAKGEFVELTAVTITRRAAERAFDAYRNGHGPDRILQMVSTDPRHHRRNSGTELDEYWDMCAQCIVDAHRLGITYNGTVSTIWGSPFKEFVPTLDRAIEFVKRFLDIGADDIEHADHDGSLRNAADAFKYYSMVRDPTIMGSGPDGRDYTDPKLHVAHFHAKNMILGLSNVVGALRAGIIRFESTLCGIGGEPANKVDGQMIAGREPYYTHHFNHGLVSTEDVVTIMKRMGIETGIDSGRLMDVSGRFRARLEEFNTRQVSLGQETMACRSMVLTKGNLPDKVLEMIAPT
jgi:hydroxymethylglutaryl-CoA lyase